MQYSIQYLLTIQNYFCDNYEYATSLVAYILKTDIEVIFLSFHIVFE